MGRKAGIKFTVGGTTYTDPTAGMVGFQKNARTLKKRLGELTKPFDIISAELLKRIVSRIDNDEYAPIGALAKDVRVAKGFSEDTPALVASGKFRSSIIRRPGPSKTKGGASREVLTLRLGSIGVSYAREILEDHDWTLPVFIDTTGESEGFKIDYDRLPGSQKSNAQMYGDDDPNAPWNSFRWESDEENIPVRGRDVFELRSEDKQFIHDQIEQYLLNTKEGL